MKIAWWKAVLIGAVLVWALFNAWPRAGRPFLNMSLGLDLRGGSHIVMEVQTNDAVKAEADLIATRIGEKLRKIGLTDARVNATENAGEVVVTNIPAGRTGEVQTALAETTGTNWATSTSGNSISVRMPDPQADFVRDNAVQQALYTIRNRVDAFGVGEVNIQRLGGEYRNRILVELPGVEDPTRVKGLIQTQARLELRGAYYAPDGSGPFQGATREDVVAALGGALPTGVEVLPVLEQREAENPLAQGAAPQAEPAERQIASYMAVERASVITGSDLADARRTQGQWGDSVVSFQTQVGAAERFAQFTRANTGRQMPIVLDDKIISAPVIRTEIGMNGQIEGNFTAESANDLAVQLRAGALPARVLTIEERTVGPSLGRDSIRSGIRAALIGAAMVCGFMLVYYKLSGLNAMLALFLNVLILAGGMASVGAVLTLPGIAGYALTVGMAVDASVLIFERIREELRAGRTIRDAIKKGYEKAFSAIFDSNLTTIVSAAFLLQYGTGPVRGFAVSLMIGLIANLFTAVFVSRFVYELVIGERPVKSLSI